MISQYRIAVQSLRMNRVRTFLTTLGIVIGVASITLVLSLGGGIRQAVGHHVEKLGGNIMLVRSGAEDATKNLSEYNPYGIVATPSLTELDMNTVRLNENIASSAPVMVLGGSIASEKQKNNSVQILATNHDFAKIVGLEIQKGEFIDGGTDRETAVIGSRLAVDLFGTDQVLGQKILIKGKEYIVIGVVKNVDMPINLSGVDFDRTVYISFDAGKSFNQGVGQIQQILATSKSSGKLSSLRQDIEKLILKNHRDERDFRVLVGGEVSSQNSSLFGSIVTVIALVSLVTLVVGGVGIMNIMLVGVSERTREIGIRKALGASNHNILSQFLIEALIMCLVGGIVGLVSAYGLAFLIAKSLAFSPVVSWQIVSIGMAMAFIVGIIFGLYPALKASRKDPIESLRQYQ